MNKTFCSFSNFLFASLDHTLRIKPIFHPYSCRSDQPPIKIGIGIASPPTSDLSVESYKGAIPPGSPLSEQDDSISSLPGACIIPTPPPKDTLKSSYHKTACKAVDLYLDVQCNFAQQNANDLEKAHTHIENELSALRNHQHHWGADVLLQEQLKNKKDTLTKVDKWEAVSEKQGASSRKKGAK
ncbi:hypothetical protein BT96DRAFT_947971 [Gymnopus androsaceus JB14]|uniref:Uncharacterized protein n=1 Tax=Gymnopus androsaceus JB14 TaxID=1447944 RepID=A0A6A4GQN2_9AGAR|nr:hypothetical protein BT96DRAFT_947971 [Gymnopus androsaceus JB14]